MITLKKGKPAVKKEIEKPNVLVAPANFEQFIRLNFEKIKKEKNIVVDFLIWDRHETIPFKITYLGENKLNGENTQLFKMNVSNFLIAAFVEPIRVWYSQDMSQIKRYLGRVAVKQKNKDGSYSDLDADVLYRYK